MLPYSADFEKDFIESGKDAKTLAPEEAQPQIDKIIR